MPGIGIILNPHSRSNRKNPDRIKRLGFIVGDKGSCKMTQDILDIPAIIHEFKEKKIDILGISGGDGTNHCTLTTMIEEYGDTPLPKIAFLRGGTMNAIPNALGIHGSPEQILSNLIIKYHNDELFETTKVNLLNVNGKYGFLFGNGLISRFIELFYRNKTGPLGAFWLFAKVTVGILINSLTARELTERFNAKVVVDGKEWRFKNFVFVGGGTMEDFVFGFKPFYRARSKADHFQLIGGAGSPFQVLSSLRKILFSKPPNRRFYEDDIAKEVDIYTDKPQHYMVDGDMQEETSHINLKIGPLLEIIIR